MECQHEIIVEPDRDLVRIVMTGFFTPSDVASLDAKRAAAFARLRCPANRHLTLCDTTAMKIQSQEVVAAFTAFAANPRFRSRRLAIVVGSSLARLQTQRATSDCNVGFFRDVAAAELWLFAAEQQAA